MPLQNKLIALLAALCVALSILLFSIREVPVSIALAGLAIIWLSILPTFLYLRDGDFAVVPFLPMLGVFYLFFFGIPIFVFQYIDGTPTPRAYEQPLVAVFRDGPILLIAAGLAVQVAVFVFAKSTWRRLLPGLKVVRTEEPRTLSFLAWILVIGHLVYRYLPQIENLPSIGQFLEPVGFVAFGLLILLGARSGLSRMETIALYGIALPLEIYSRVQTIFLTQILLFCLAVIFVLWRMRAFRVLGLVAAFSLLVLTGYGATAGVRDPSASRLDNFYNIAKAYVTGVILEKPSMINVGGGFTPLSGRFNALIQRTAHSWMFHRVYEMTPDQVPYWGGETYLPLLTSFIPRVLYHDKPEERAGLKFGITYKLILPDSVTSVNIPWITELLMNFGPVAVIIGMAIFGVLLALIDRVFNAPDIGDVAFAIGIPILVKFAYPESNFSVSVGSVPLFVLCMFLYFRFGSLFLARVRPQPSN